MDLTSDEILSLFADPKTKDDIIEKLKANVKVLEDENGVTCSVIPLKDGALPAHMVLAGMSVPMGMKKQDIRNIPIRDDDIIVIDYPKTGTHWLTNLIYFMLKEGPLEDVSSYAGPLLEMFNPEIVEKMQSPRILATHRPPTGVPRDIFKKRGKVILIYRNPKDTAVSLFYHLRNMTNSTISWNCHIENWIKGLIPTSDFFDYHQQWEKLIAENKDFEFHLVCYEDLKKDGVQELKRLCKFLGLSLPDDRLQEVIDRCSLKKLKTDVETGAVKMGLMNKEGKAAFYRKGIIGDWKNHFTVAQNETIDAVIKDKCSQTVFKFKY